MLKHLMIAVSMSALMVGGALAQAPAASEPPTMENAGQAAPMTQAEPQAQPQADTQSTGTASADQCLQSAMTLAKSAEQKSLADDKLDKIEQMLAKMEDLCDANQFSEAQAMVKDIESAIKSQ